MVNSLKHRHILTINDIEGYRKEIVQAMPDADKTLRAKALSSVVAKQLDNCLYGIEIPKRASIKKDVISEFLQTYEPVTYHLLMEKIIVHSDEPHMVSYLDRWLVLSAGIRIPETTLSGVIREIKENLKKEVVLSSLGRVTLEEPEKDDVLPEAFFKPELAPEKPAYKLRVGVLLGYVALLLMGGILLQSLSEFTFTWPTQLTLSKKRIDFVRYSPLLVVEPSEECPELHAIVLEIYHLDSQGVPPYLRYNDFSHDKLLAYLGQKNSMLTQKTYFNTIVRTAKRHDLNPLLLFAISGQEQGFVPRNAKYLNKIINNPYNVYNSWENYNTTLKDSTEIAAGTIVELLENRPRGQDPFKWLNSRYAEDDNWWRGTKIIFNQLTTIAKIE